MNIRLATYSDQAAWDAYVLNHPEGLGYHQFAWRKAVEEAYGFEGLYLVAESEGRFCGVLPLIDFNIPLLGRTLISLPYCDVGGGLADDLDIGGALIDQAKDFARAKKAKRLEMRLASPFGESDGALEESSSKVRMILDLPGSSEALLGSLKSKLRSQVKKPVRDGLTARLGGLELVDDFYHVFAENMRDLGSPVHSKKWIQAVVSQFGEGAKVGVVYSPEGSPAAAGIVLLHKTTVSIPWASSLRHLNRLNPNMLLYWSFLAFAADHGFKRFDFGRSTPGEGTYRFKEQWGAKPQALCWISYPPGDTLTNGARNTPSARKHAEQLWRRMPLVFCNAVGPLLRRNISL